MSRRPRLPLALTMGDPLGIGPEICLKAAAAAPVERPLLLVGERETFAAARALAPTAPPIIEVEDPEQAVEAAGLALLTPPAVQARSAADDPAARAGAAAYAAILSAIDLALEGRVAGMATAPIEKAHLAAAGVPHPGHTEILAERAGAPVAMMLANDELRVVLVSIHVSLAAAVAAVTLEAELAAIRRAHLGAQALGIAAPRVAVAGLNPHAGEGGLFGREEIEVIAPAIAAARSEGIDASGPWPGDTVFMNARQGRFDVVVAQYHDQGLIPVKYLGLEQGVNVTLGLPFIRTSPDHGTARDIAGRGVADPRSMIAAIRMADRLFEHDAPSLWR